MVLTKICMVYVVYPSQIPQVMAVDRGVNLLVISFLRLERTRRERLDENKLARLSNEIGIVNKLRMFKEFQQ